MLTLIFVFYYFSRFWTMLYLISSFILAVFLYVKSAKYFYPNTKDEEPNFHKEYIGFNRIDLHHFSFGRILYGVLNYYWIRLVLNCLAFVGFYLYFK